MSDFPEFRVIELKYPHPTTGARFWIEWEVELEREEQKPRKGLINFIRAVLGLKLIMDTVLIPYKKWEIFSDPATTESNIGYRTMAEALFVIERYKVVRTPIIHKV